MVRHAPDLEGERRHVLEQPVLDHLAGLDIAFLAVGEALFEKARDRPERLQIGPPAHIVQRNGNGEFSLDGARPGAGCFFGYDAIRAMVSEQTARANLPMKQVAPNEYENAAQPRRAAPLRIAIASLGAIGLK